MQKVDRPQGKWRNIVFGCVALLVILADQLSKTWIRANLTPGETLFDAGFLQFVHVQNTGAIFGLFKGHSLTLTILSIIGIIVILLLVFVLRSRWSFLNSMLVITAIGLIMGGTVGNLIDRINMGYVTDFIDFKIWPVWNIADAAVTVGEIIIICCIIFVALPARHKE